MSEEELADERRRDEARVRRTGERVRREDGASHGYVEGVGFFDPPIYPDQPLEVAEEPATDERSRASAQAPTCDELVEALNHLRSELVDRAVSHAAPGIGQEAMAFLHVDEGIRYEGLRGEIERLERAIEAAGCPV